MAGITQRITIDDEAARGALDAAIALGQDLTPVLDEIGAQVVSTIELRFEAGLAPDGTPWQPSRRAREQGGRTLIDSRRLLGSLSHQPDATGVDVGFNAIYAAIHHFGGTIKAKPGKRLRFFDASGKPVFRRKVTIPRRPLIGTEDFDPEDIGAVVADFVADAFGGPA